MANVRLGQQRVSSSTAKWLAEGMAHNKMLVIDWFNKNTKKKRREKEQRKVYIQTKSLHRVFKLSYKTRY